ncbi:hypothetical protein NJL88_03055 [Streptomyces sp. DK15]|uniref:hypothetical protein n=1 Tax=Streptomyces sp. DK15 TaxID=2957499 RepID=UPI0029B20CF8|nr:hypothetical protein [Streptomyces sp. DK15]MDX2389083.1 hypothetical protein [Streptomyces sp. DK15]
MAGLESLASFAPFFVPVVTGVVGGISLIIRDRRNSRSADHHYRRRLERAQMEVQFITGWIEAKRLAPTATATATATVAPELSPAPNPGPEPEPEPGRWLDECYASVRSFEVASRHRRGGPGRLRRLLLLRPLRGRTAQALRVLYWISLLIFNAALAWWVSMIVDGPPAFLGDDPESRSDDIDSTLGLAGSFLLAAVVLWVWTVRLDASDSGDDPASRIDVAAWTAREDERRRAAGGKRDGERDAGPGGERDAGPGGPAV